MCSGGHAFVIAAIWKNDLRHYLILLNLIAFAALLIYLAYAALSPRRARAEEKSAPNLTPFLPDADLEGRRLERVQGWALIFAAVIAVALPLYWLREPTRQHQIATYFDDNSVHRGAVLFAGPSSAVYNAAISKQCANCHGEKGEGGTAPFRINGKQVGWKAPPLNTEALRFTEEPDCADPSLRSATTVCEITEIITHGRPGTPMQGWGVAGGGPLNDQGIADLVAYIKSIQISPEQAQQQATDALATAKSTTGDGTCAEYTTCPAIEVKAAQAKLDSAQKSLDGTRKDALRALEISTATDAELSTRCRDVSAQIKANPTDVPQDLKNDAVACGTFLDDLAALKDARAGLAWSQEWQRRRANASDGQILFEMNCARCHTEGWSVFDPTVPPPGLASVDVLGPSGGGGGFAGGIGFNLRDGDTVRRFGDDESDGWSRQVQFVTDGSDPDKEYGYRGFGSGRMPGFGQMLQPEQIAAIVSYERYCLENTDYHKVEPYCSTPTTPRTPPTSTTTTPAAGGG